MYFTIDNDKFNPDYIYFCEPTKNTILNNSTFVRMLYSSQFITLNGICLNLCLVGVSQRFKCKLEFDINNANNIQVIQELTIIEDYILRKYGNNQKTPSHKLREQLNSGCIKVFNHNYIIHPNNNSFALKISGLWETESEYGLTFKFVRLHSEI